MQIPVLVERVKGDGYRARSSEPLPLKVKGATREEALAKLREKILVRLGGDTEVVGLEFPEPHPWKKYAGMFKDDPLFDDWQRAIAEYRRKVNEDADYL